jgi:methyl-accepting chemotaxis protein
MDLNSALQKHTAWKHKFLTSLRSNEKLDVPSISKDTICELGNWLNGKGRKLYAKYDSYARCVVDHAAFHVEAGRIATAANANRLPEAQRLIAPGSTFDTLSKKVSLLIVELKNEAGIEEDGGKFVADFPPTTK